ncbi:nitrogen regulation protein NR(I) [Polaromonas sp.]|jgi:two-component system nitrogen regulation response regulator GlnG|uniref:nitrogen regulation protein NR(I) n=1 Tax=Polaromonas sp. TaxID=1869339 RepID=UPI0037C9995A
MKPIWIVDDDQSIRFVLEKALLREGLPTRSFTNPREVLNALESATEEDGPQILVSDIRMPGGSGLDLLEKVKEKLPGLPVIIMTAFSDLDSAVSAFQGGAFEYLPKPFDLPKAVELIRRAVEESQREEVAEERMAATPEMLGQAPAMQDVFRAIGRLSQSMVTVMITGESGSGKELVARALHKHSPRANGPFVAINTAAIPKDLLESELFGHERGAFTGAQTMRRGRFEQADGGTLFLDEIGDMPFDLQTRLLRVLSDGNFYRVGGHNAVKTNVRVIAATHQDLEQRVKEGGFREDLFHRLNVIRLRLPALRERREDVFMLTRHFLQQSAKQLGVEPKRISDAALQQLSTFSFPGNVRQLENICHWLTVMAPAQVIEAKDLPPEVLGAVPEPGRAPVSVEGGTAPQRLPSVPVELPRVAAPDVSHAGAAVPPAEPGSQPVPTAGGSSWESGLEAEAMALLATGRSDVWDVLTRRFESKLIQTALLNTRGRRIEAAQKLGIGRNTITRKIQELNLE